MTQESKTAVFLAKQFTPTEFSTALEKARMANLLLKFILNGCQPKQFTKALYQRVMHLWGHIAHYNHEGFTDTWFELPSSRYEFVRRIVMFLEYGDPSYTWCDVERAIRLYLADHPVVLALLEKNAKGDQEMTERAMLKDLLAKYPDVVEEQRS